MRRRVHYAVMSIISEVSLKAEAECTLRLLSEVMPYSECYAPPHKAQYTSKATVGACWSECAVRSCTSHQHFTAKTMKLGSKVYSQNKEKFRLVITQCEA